MKSDIEIARDISLKPIKDIGEAIGIPRSKIIPFGKHKAKVPYQLIDEEKVKQSKLILVTAITPNKAGVGKTTTSISLALGLNKIGKKAIVALREPSLGPCFGMKGGAAGGGHAQVLPMEDINLHFTGDFHAITSAHNMISALLDNYQYQNRNNDKRLRAIKWKRVLDVNDRALREIITGMGSPSNGVLAESGFDITAASEIMAILCLATSLEDLENRIDNILLGYTQNNQAFTVKDLGIGGAITVLLKDAIHPNLVQTTEHTPAFIHGGPFANIAHGCNSIIATKLAMTFGDYVVTEAGFGADLGAEKFFNIKCRVGNLQPKASVVVVTTQALKLHGGTPEAKISQPDMEGLQNGLNNLKKHLQNLHQFGQSCIVALNLFSHDVENEVHYIQEWCKAMGVKFAVNRAHQEGGKGAIDLAEAVVDLIEHSPSQALHYTYGEEEHISNKIRKIAQKVYGAEDVKFDNRARKMLARIEHLAFDRYPVCIAKTQYSFSDNPKKTGVAKGFFTNIEDLIINSGAGFIIAKAGTIMRMPGLPASPQAEHIKIANGQIEGLS
ncbi:formate--tetrahydrofolate ligase [Rapidithrix thailandica]|uniref:Formate--tetrahydrofolate ligase n=1 Tax=Rapidithrix thailandica TaxID=413964 RepID=A0AAW9S1G2_9BACT